MSEVLDKLRAKFPDSDYTKASDRDLTLAIGVKYPYYLDADAGFAADFAKYSNEALFAPVDYKSTEQKAKEWMAEQPPAPAQPEPEKPLTWFQEVSGAGPSIEAAKSELSQRDALIAQHGQQWYDDQVKAIQTKYRYFREAASTPEARVALNQQELQDWANLGVGTIGVGEPVSLPKLTEGEAQTLLGNSRAGKAAATAQRVASGVAEGFVSDPMAMGMAFGPGLAGKLAGVAKPLSKLTQAEIDAVPSLKAAVESSKIIGASYVPGMAATTAAKTAEAVKAYAAGDTEKGDAAAIEAATTGLMTSIPLKHALQGAGVLPKNFTLPSLKPEIPVKPTRVVPPYPPEARALGIGPERWSILTDDQQTAVANKIIEQSLAQQAPAPAPVPVAPPVPAASPAQAPGPIVAPPKEEQPIAELPSGPVRLGIQADPDVALPLRHGPGDTLTDLNGKPVEQILDESGDQRWVLTKPPETSTVTEEPGTPGGTEPTPSPPTKVSGGNSAAPGPVVVEAPAESPPGQGAYYTPAQTLAALADLIRQGPVTKREAADILAQQYGGSMRDGKFTAKDMGDAFEMALNKVIMDGGPMRGESPEVATAVVKSLKDLVDRTPTQTTRTAEMDRLQQFSTPPPLSYVANWVANLKPTDVVLEPSAGVGGLAVMAKKAGAGTLIGNELDPRRAELLKQSGLADYVTQHNAEHLQALMEPALAKGEIPRPTAVVMNPPFSNAAMSGGKNTMVGAKHVEEALRMLPKGGRLVAIVGKGMALDRPTFKAWWKKIAGEYNVRANVQVNGQEYRKYGTSFDNQLLVIDNNGKTPDVGGIVRGRVEKVEDLIPLLERIRNERPEIGTGTTEQAPAQSSGNPPNGGAGGGPAERPNANANPGTGPLRVPPGPEVSGGAGPGNAGGKSTGGLGKAGRGKAGSGAEGTEPAKPGVGGEGRPGAGVGSDNLNPAGSEQRDKVIAQTEGISLEKLNEARAQLNETGVFSEYAPRKVRIKGAQPHVSPLVEPTAMAAVDPVDPTYTPKLPREIITSGKLSATGIEQVVYAGQAHSKILPNGDRMGYFIGDGTGVGKGRQITSIILDNWNQGRRRSVWLSKNIDLINDAKRDFEDMGVPLERVIDFSKNGGKALTGAGDGTAFAPYSSLRVGNPGLTKDGTLFPPEEDPKNPGQFKKARMHLLQEWLGKDFDGPIIFDEAHLAGNAIDVKGKRGIKRASEQGKMVLDVQRLFPKARIVYSSATGATDVTNLSYADRLGIWGHGTPFSSKERFFEQIRAGGLSAMEIVARDLKSMGRYLARSLSFEGVDHRQLVHKLTDEQRNIYDELSRGWQYVLQHRDETMAMTGAAQDGRARSAANSAFYGAQQRFYNQLLTAMQMPSILRDVKAELSKGNSAVLQLVNTDEAAQTRQIAEKASEAGVQPEARGKGARGKAEERPLLVPTHNYLEDLDLSPKEILLQYIENSYPTTLFEPVADDNGNVSFKPVRDANGNIVQDPRAIQRKQELSDKIALLKAPTSPLGMLLDELGVENVAEITGRGQRVVSKLQDDGTRKRVLEKNRGNAVRKVETQEFQDGKKRVLVFSDAGGTGKSYHASRSAKNQERRIHYLMQAGWRADAALQGFGRTHRSNQSSAPEYVLASTDIKGHQRFISTIARRLSELGALTGGERKSKGGEMFAENSNLENEYASDGVDALFMDLFNGRVPGVELNDIARKLGYTKKVVDEHTGETKEINTLIDPETGGLNVEKVPSIQQFLNRILALEVGEQNHLFGEFEKRMAQRIQNAKVDGSYDPGTQTLKAEAIRKVADDQVYKDPDSTAATRLVKIEHDHPQTKVEFDQLASGEPVTSYLLNNRSSRIYAIKRGPTRTTSDGGLRDTYYRLHPGGGDTVFADELNPNNYTRVDETKARTIWADQLASLPKMRTDTDTYVVGAFLPIWDRLQLAAPKIWRITTDKGETLLGAHVPARQVADLRARLGAGMGQRTPEDVFRGVLQGETIKLANGWSVGRRRIMGEPRIEVTGPSMNDLSEFEKHLGGFMERIQYTPRFFLPTDDANGIASMEKLLAKAPVAGPKEASHPMVSGQEPEGTPYLASSPGSGVREVNQSEPSANPLTQVLPSQLSIQTRPPDQTLRMGSPSDMVGPSTFSVLSEDSGTTSKGVTVRRKVFQNGTDYKALLKGAEAMRPWLDNALKAVSEASDGIQFSASRVKHETRLQEKLATRGANQVSDFIGGRLLVRTPGDMAAADAAIRQQFEVVDLENKMDGAQGGYRALHYQVRLPNGMSAEVQIIPEAMEQARHEAHKVHQLIPPGGRAEGALAEMEAKARVGMDTAYTRWLTGETEHPFLSSTSFGQGVAKDLARLRSTVAPQAAGSPAQYVANLLRELNSKMANEMARADKALRPFRNTFDKTPVPKDWRYDPVGPLPRNLAFIDAYEGGTAVGLGPMERAAVGEFKKLNDDWVARVRALGTGALDTVIQNYFPHLWDDPKKAQRVMAAVMAKRPLEGTRSFLKERTYNLFREGLAAGLRPVSDNPVDLWMLKKREVEKFIVANSLINDTRRNGLLKFTYVFAKPQDGYTRVNDSAFTVYGPPSVTIKEAFDAGMRSKTLEVLQHLGVPHERLVRIGGQQWGRERDIPGQPGTERLATKFGGPDFVIWHELGHALDNRYSDLRDIVMGPEIERQQVAALNMRRQPIPANLTKTAALVDQLRKLADERVGGAAPPAFKQHVRETPEKMATILQAYLHAPDVMAKVAPLVKAQFEKFMQVHPELQELNDIRPTLRLGEAAAEMPHGGLLKMGEYYLPDQAAQVLNNYLSPGLGSHQWYQTLRQTSNFLNGVQLGLSAFHLGFTSLDAATSRLAVAIEDAMHGKIGRAAVTLATVPVSPLTNLLQGRKLVQEALKPGSTDAATAQLVHALEAGGGRIGQDAFWKTEFTRRMTRALHEGTATGYLKGALTAPLALWEQTMRPIMEYIVPRQKLGVFADMAKREILRLGPNAGEADVRAAMQKAWDSVDNRMGQMVYDNLFYNRMVKDVALLSFRAFGWQLGKYREGLGALGDLGGAAKKLAQLQTPEFTHRMAYAMALPIMVGTLGGVTNYLMTGTQPQGKDWFMPRTGEKDRNGNDLRLNFPSYVKDVIAYSKHPLTSFGHSLNPLGSTMMDLLMNKDFYDVRIRNPDDPLVKQGADMALFLAKQFIPFSVSGAMKMQQNEAPARQQILPFFGITPVPQRMTMTPAQELASELFVAQMPKAPRSKEQFNKSKLVAEIVGDMKSSDEGRLAAGRAKFQEGFAAQTLNVKSAMTIIEKLGYNPMQFQVHHLDSESAMKIWRVANQQERQQLLPMIVAKVAFSKTLSDDTRAQYLRELAGKR